MEKYCKNCIHYEEDLEYNPGSLVMGIAIFQAPIPFGPSYKHVMKCHNMASVYYLDKVDDYDHCKDFEEK
jgi:hypothetical protein